MELEELLQILTQSRDLRYKHKMKTKKPYYIIKKHKQSKILYVKYTDTGIQFSTGETDPIKAEKFAIEHLGSHTKKGMKAFNNRDEFHKLLLDYYKKGSPHIEYCIKHNRKVSEIDRPNIENVMKRICKLTPDVKKYTDLTKQRLIKLQNDLLEHGSATGGKLSAKSVKNYFFDLHRIYKELLDYDLIENDPFVNLPPLKITLTQAWGGLPLSDFENNLPLLPDTTNKEFSEKHQIIYSLLAFIAVMTGMRRGEIERINFDSVKEIPVKDKENGIGEIKQNWLYVDGTKTAYSKRTIPITETTAKLIKAWAKLKEQKQLKFLKSFDYNNAVLFMGKACGFNTLEEMKTGDEKVVFHGFRKMYRTILTQQNINRDLIDYCMGKQTLIEQDRRNVKNDKDTYTELAKSDKRQWHGNITNALAYFERTDTDFFDFFCYGVLELELDIEKAFELAEEARKNKVKFCQFLTAENGAFWGREFTPEEKAENRKRLDELGLL